MSNELDPYPGNLRRHEVVELGRSEGKTKLIKKMSTTKHTGSPEEHLLGLIDKMKPVGQKPLIQPSVCETMDKAAIWSEYELDRDRLIAENERLRKALQMAVDAMNGATFPNCLSADEVALLAMNNAGSQESIDTAREIANDYRAAQEGLHVALAAAKELNVTPTER